MEPVLAKRSKNHCGWTHLFTLCYLADDFLCGRVDDRKSLTILSIHKLIVDEEL